MGLESASIYIDLYKLYKALFFASYEMAKKDRMIYGDAMFKNVSDCISFFVMSYKLPEEKIQYTKKLIASFEVLKIHLRMMVELHIFKGKVADDGSTAIEREIFDIVAKIDESITKWHKSITRGRAMTE